METFENKTQNPNEVFVGDDEAHGIKQKLGQLGRRIKRVDLRSTIIEHPLPAIGVAAAVGALIGLARPMPKRNPLTGALIAIASTIGFRVMREAVMVQLLDLAKERFGGQRDASSGMAANVPQAGSGAV
jgi:hypothetical protein